MTKLKCYEFISECGSLIHVPFMEKFLISTSPFSCIQNESVGMLNSGNVVPKHQTAEPEWDIMWTLCPNDLLPHGLFDSTEQVYMGTGKLKMTSVLQGSPCKSPFCHANFLSVSFYLSSSSFNCLFLHMHGEVGWTCLLIFLCSCKEENNCFSQQFTWTDSSEQVQLQEENIKKPFWNWQFLPI